MYGIINVKPGANLTWFDLPYFKIYKNENYELCQKRLSVIYNFNFSFPT